MRWELLLADVEAQAQAADDATLAGEVADRTRLEQRRLTLADRLRARRGEHVRLQVRGAGPIGGVVRELGPDWVLVVDEQVPDRDTVIALEAIDVVHAADQRAAMDDAGPGARSQDLAWVLSRLARDRAGVRVHLREGTSLGGTLDRVGADHVDLALHDGDALRRADHVRGLVSIAIPAIAAIVRV